MPTIEAAGVDSTADTNGKPDKEDAVATVHVPTEDGWVEYLMTEDSKLTVDRPNGEPAAIIQTHE